MKNEINSRTIPYIDKNKCTACLLCTDDCISKAITKDKIEIIPHRCMLCSHCTAICPSEAISIRGETGDVLEPLPEQISEFTDRLIKKRRSVRNYTSKRVSREEIDRILKTVSHSPTGTNSDMVEITILDNREKITELTDIVMNHFDKMTKILLNGLTYPLFLFLLGKKKTGKIFNYKKIIASYGEGKNILTHDAPLLMIFHVNRKSSTPGQDGIIWATTAMYSAESLGLGTCFNGFLVIGINTCRKARKFLNIPKGNKVYETFTAGYPRFIYKRYAVKKNASVTFI